MTARRHPRPQEDGVSNVLGAVLMFGLLVLTLTVIQVRFVPVWGEDREAAHMQALADDLRNLKSDLDRQASNDTATSVTEALELRRSGGFRWFQPQGDLGGMASFSASPTATGIQVSSNNPVEVLRRDGRDLFGLSTDWPDYEDDDIEDVVDIEFLRLRIDMSPLPADDTSIRLNIYDTDDNVNPIGWVLVTALDFPSEKALYLQVFDASGDEVASDQEAYFQQTVIDYIYWDLLSPEYVLQQVLQSGVAPYRLELIEDGMPANYQIVYTDAESGGLAGGAGVSEPSFLSTQASGRLEVETANVHYEDQTYILEHGAVLVEQGSGSAIVAPPSLSATLSATQASIAWTVGGLSGDGMSRTGDRVAAVVTPTGNVEDVWILASSITITIPTNNGAAWVSYLGDLLTANGWSSAQYTLSSTSSQAQLDLQGPVLNDVSNLDISMRFRVSEIDLELTPVG